MRYGQNCVGADAGGDGGGAGGVRQEPRGGVWRRGLQSGGAAAVRGGGFGAAVRAVGRGHVRGARRAVQLAGGGHGAHRDFCEPRREFRQ